MYCYQYSHHVALRALLVAAGLPMVLCMFMAIRNKQLQSTANPRWAQFARVTGPTAEAPATPPPSNRKEVKTASVNGAAFFFMPTVVATDVEPAAEPAVEPAKPEPIEIPQQIEPPTPLQSDHHVDNAQLGTELANLLKEIREQLSRKSSKNAADEKPPVESAVLLPAEIAAEEQTLVPASPEIPFSPESIPDADLRQFLNRFSDATKVKSLAADEQLLPEPPAIQIPSAAPAPEPTPVATIPTQTQQGRSTITTHYAVRRDGAVTLICTADEANRLKPDQLSRVARVSWPKDVHGVDHNQILSTIVKGLSDSMEIQTVSQSITESGRRDTKFAISRRALARVFFDSATISIENGDATKARKQVEASLRHFNNDIEAIRLRNVLNQMPGQLSDH